MSLYAEVVLSLPMEQVFTYRVPSVFNKKVKIGSRVLIPFHKRSLTGFVVGLKKRRTAQSFELKEIYEVLDEEPIFTSSFLTFTKKLSDYNYEPWGEILQASLPPSLVPRSKEKVLISEEGKSAFLEGSLSGDEQQIVNCLLKGPYTAAYLRRKCGIKNLSPLLARLEKKRLIQIQKEIRRPARKKEKPVFLPPMQIEMDFSLDKGSRHVADIIIARMQKSVFFSYLVFGPSEKREAVYFALIKEMLRLRRKVLFLVPEISFTRRLKILLEKRLGERAAILHSKLSERQRESSWKKVREGLADVVVGPRSAIFSPLEDIGLIIVEEEEDESYYQRENPSYDARTGAWLRAKLGNSVLVKGSSAPSVEEFSRAKKKGSLLRLKEEEIKPGVNIIGIPRTGRIIANPVLNKMRKRLERKETVIVFFNRRGYATSLSCVRCGHAPRCIRCDIPLHFHKREKKLICHYCNYSISQSKECPECRGGFSVSRSFGIEAVEEELRQNFPQRRIVCFDTDAVKGRRGEEKVLLSFSRGEIDILVGTQLLAHQSELVPVSCVVILFPETLLTLPDFRASQKTFQSLIQMKQLLGNEEGSELVIQTAFPHHHSIHSAFIGDYDSFFRKEIDYREVMNYPPFSAVAEVYFFGENLRTLARDSRTFSLRARSLSKDCEILGPALASISMVRGKNRIQVILKAKKKLILDRILRESLKEVRLRRSIRIYE